MDKTSCAYSTTITTLSIIRCYNQVPSKSRGSQKVMGLAKSCNLQLMDSLSLFLISPTFKYFFLKGKGPLHPFKGCGGGGGGLHPQLINSKVSFCMQPIFGLYFQKPEFYFLLR